MLIDPLQQKRVLFVDDDDSVLCGMRRVFHSMRNSWDVEFSRSAREALDILAAKPIDLVIADMQMPGTSGAELLAITCRLYPRVIRFALSGYTDIEILMKAAGLSHQFFAKPCNADILKSAMIRGLHFQDVLRSECFQAMVATVQALPVLPEHIEMLSALLGRGPVTVREVAALVEQDVGMAAKVFHLARWDYFDPRHCIRNVERAVQNLGLDFLRHLMATTNLFRSWEEATIRKFGIREVLEHSVGVGALAEQSARTMTPEDVAAEDARAAGLMHDVGKLVMINAYEDEYSLVWQRHRTSRIPLHVLEQEAFGVTHADIGGALMILWGLPAHIVEAVEFHHRPQKTGLGSYNTVMSVHMADCMAHNRPGAEETAEGRGKRFPAHALSTSIGGGTE